MTKARNKPLVLLASLMVLVTAVFWLGSRYPALNEKNAMGVDTPLSSLGFTTLVDIAPDERLVPRIFYETVNWIYSNGPGMLFGIVFAALVITMLGLFERRGVRTSFGNSVIGILIGTPLGVCVNCAAPIAKAIHAAGGRAETMLAAMISSPTLNIVVLTMLFSLFPIYMAVIKIGMTVGMCANLSWKLKRLQTPWFDGIGRNNIKPVRERSRDEESVTFGKETQEVACAG